MKANAFRCDCSVSVELQRSRTPQPELRASIRRAITAAAAAAKTPDDPVAAAVAAAAVAARKAAEARARPGGALYLPERISVPPARVALNKFR